MEWPENVTAAGAEESAWQEYGARPESEESAAEEEVEEVEEEESGSSSHGVVHDDEAMAGAAAGYPTGTHSEEANTQPDPVAAAKAAADAAGGVCESKHLLDVESRPRISSSSALRYEHSP